MHPSCSMLLHTKSKHGEVATWCLWNIVMISIENLPVIMLHRALGTKQTSHLVQRCVHLGQWKPQLLEQDDLSCKGQWRALLGL